MTCSVTSGRYQKDLWQIEEVILSEAKDLVDDYRVWWIVEVCVCVRVCHPEHSEGSLV